MSIDAKWVDHVIAEWNLDPVPELCQQWACNRPVETWCPLCRAYLCAIHDALGLSMARQLVHAELAKSPAWRVRDAVTPSELPAESTGTLPDSDDPEDLPY